ncbi:outer membrane beta-barrel family protein [Cellulophaga sp. Z1A5H]|uniref:outer membrane beta-barrel family protein n=1 Tax=Cellulophaga sp. Z1A5H TaxID=2687291 RepID=UPI0013FD6332|nr:outer membrane beta-barrel family protein [Cellulophaga sp. Z1A5H]
MKLYNNVFLYVFLICSSSLIAQTFKVEGNVKDDLREAIPFANVYLLKAADTTLVYGGSTEEDGTFEIKDVAPDNYLLRANYLGQTSKLIAVVVTKNTNVGELVLAEHIEALSEVVVTNKKPIIERKADRIIFNVANSALAQGSSWDILKRTPGVIIMQGEIKLKNRAADVYINDRKVYLTADELQQLLQGLDGGNIEAVEVITNPPSKYDAAGNSILNITTTKNLSIGYKGAIHTDYAIAIKPKYTFGTNHYYKNDWLNSYVSYSLNTKEEVRNGATDLLFAAENGMTNSIWESRFKRATHTNTHTINSLFEFYLNDKNTINVSVSSVLSPKIDSDRNELTTMFDANMMVDSLYDTSSTTNDYENTHLFTVQHISKLGEKGTELTTQGNYIVFDKNQEQNLDTKYRLPDNTILNENRIVTLAHQKTKIYTLQSDLIYPTEHIVFETGLKYSGINSTSEQEFENSSSNTTNESFNGIVADNFDYDENIFAGYISTSKEWDAFTVKGGLRGEYTNSKGNSLVLAQINSNSYFNLFPTLFLQYQHNENHLFGLNFNRRITRPPFQLLNPFITFINENNVVQGNPKIQPSITNRITASYTLKNKLTFDFYVERIKNDIYRMPFQNNEQQTISTITDNLINGDQVSIDVTYQDYITDNWYLYAYSSFFYLKNQFYARANNNQVLDLDVKSCYILAQNYISFLEDKSLNAVITASYMPTFISGSFYHDKAVADVSISVQKHFLDKSLIVSLGVDDLLNATNIPVTSNYLDQNYSYYSRPETRMFTGKAVYKFGNFKLKNSKAEAVEEQERLLNKD